MIPALIANIVLSAIVFAAVIGLIMPSIRWQTPVRPVGRPARARSGVSRDRRSAAPATARPWV
jgi:hypothetical protein